MKKVIFAGCCIIINAYCYAQQHALAKQWDYRFGGDSDEALYAFDKITDNGYLFGGGSTSGISGNKTQNNWDTTYTTADFWVVKTDSSGNKQWDKRYGGYEDETISNASMHQLENGGYIFAGYSNSGIGGDKTQPSQGGNDYWMVKSDSVGNKLWDKRFGGSSDDYLFAINPANDGGYLLAGTSYSDSSGDKTHNNWGGIDYWVVKTDSLGNKEWDADYGGTDNQFLYAASTTMDGGYLLGGVSSSGISGDKTQANWAIGWYNFWLVKIDSAGNKLWDRVYGGTGADYLRVILPTPNNGFLLGGYSASDIGGDKTTPNYGGYDYWIVKIDSAGNKLWDQDYGGTEDDFLRNVTLTSDGGYLLAGDSESPASGDKTENNTAYILSWIIKTDSLGNKIWDKTIFLNGVSGSANAIQTKDGCYVIGSWTGAEVGYYKSQASWDSSSDYWIVKFCDTIISNVTELTPTVNLTIYPNPFTSDIAIALQRQGLKQATFTITNTLGQTIYNQTENNLSDNYTKMLDLSYLPNGVYFIEVTVGGEKICREVVKQ